MGVHKNIFVLSGMHNLPLLRVASDVLPVWFYDVSKPMQTQRLRSQRHMCHLPADNSSAIGLSGGIEVKRSVRGPVDQLIDSGAGVVTHSCEVGQKLMWFSIRELREEIKNAVVRC